VASGWKIPHGIPQRKKPAVSVAIFGAKKRMKIKAFISNRDPRIDFLYPNLC
jgi:hypothetical protein